MKTAAVSDKKADDDSMAKKWMTLKCFFTNDRW